MPGRAWDLPASPHLGPPAALNVPVSESRRARRFDRGFEGGLPEEHRLLRAEPRTEPLKEMELGPRQSERAQAWRKRLNRRIRSTDTL